MSAVGRRDRNPKLGLRTGVEIGSGVRAGVRWTGVRWTDGVKLVWGPDWRQERDQG